MNDNYKEESEWKKQEKFFAKANRQVAPQNTPEAEIRIYQILQNALSTSVGDGLPMDFSAKLRNKLAHQLQRKNMIRFYGSWTVVLVTFMAVLFFGLLLLDKAYGTEITKTIILHKWIFITLFPMLYLIQYLDHIIIREHQFRKTNIDRTK